MAALQPRALFRDDVTQDRQTNGRTDGQTPDQCFALTAVGAGQRNNGWLHYELIVSANVSSPF